MPARYRLTKAAANCPNSDKEYEAVFPNPGFYRQAAIHRATPEDLYHNIMASQPPELREHLEAAPACRKRTLFIVERALRVFKDCCGWLILLPFATGLALPRQSSHLRKCIFCWDDVKRIHMTLPQGLVDDLKELGALGPDAVLEYTMDMAVRQSMHKLDVRRTDWSNN